MNTDDLQSEFKRGFAQHLGSGYSTTLLGHMTIRKLAKQLADHFDAVGWPDDAEAVKPYVREAIERYG